MGRIKYLTQCKFCNRLLGLASREYDPTEHPLGTFLDFTFSRPKSSYVWHSRLHSKTSVYQEVRRIELNEI